MSISTKKTTTIIFNWVIDPEEVQKNGFVESKVFGSDSTKFFIHVGSDKSYYLYLVSAGQERFAVKLNIKIVWIFRNFHMVKLTYADDVSLDKSHKVGSSNCAAWDAPMLVVNEITFEENHFNGSKLNSPVDHHLKLCQQLAVLQTCPSLSDVILVTNDGKEFPVHKVILSARSTVFEAMFSHGELKENQKNRVEVDDVSSDIMKALLVYVYSGDIDHIDPLAGDLLVAADKYNIQPLLSACTQSMLANITISTAAQFFYIADLYKLPELKLKVTEFICKNKKSIRHSEGWREYIRPNPNLFEELFELC